MPIYEYACNACGHKFDALQKFDDPPVSVCPKCAADSVKKLISATNFVLKGGGWYSDHYGLKSGGGGAEAASGGAAKEGAAAATATPAASPAPAASAPAASAPAAPAGGTK
jgi:putative FmdB family regulatory protein